MRRAQPRRVASRQRPRDPRALLERHHPGGESNDPDLTVVVCRNCHALNTEGQLVLDVELEHDPSRSMPEQLIAVLRGLAVFFDLLARQLLYWAEQLAAHVRMLDRDHPTWRTKGGVA